MNDFAGDIGEPEVASGIAVGEPLVIDPEQVKHGGVKVVGMNPTFSREDAVFVRLTMNNATLYAASGHP